MLHIKVRIEHNFVNVYLSFYNENITSSASERESNDAASRSRVSQTPRFSRRCTRAALSLPRACDMIEKDSRIINNK